MPYIWHHLENHQNHVFLLGFIFLGREYKAYYSADVDKRANEIKILHEKFHEKTEKQNSKYKTQWDKHFKWHIFKEEHMIWIH